MKAGSAGKQFIARHGADIGVRETLDIARTYVDAHKPRVRVAANDDQAEKSPVLHAATAN